jgi:regulatory protein
MPDMAALVVLNQARLWHKHGMVSRASRSDRSRKPLSAAKLDELALAYVARFATSRAKLTRYLARKIRESEWVDESDARTACEAVVDRMERLRFLDDRQYAAMRAGAMTRRGLGLRRVKAQLFVDGIADADSGDAIAEAEEQAVAAAVGFARRRRFGPFAVRADDDPKSRERQVAAFARAGHSLALARRILAVPPGDADALAALDDAAMLD